MVLIINALIFKVNFLFVAWGRACPLGDEQLPSRNDRAAGLFQKELLGPLPRLPAGRANPVASVARPLPQCCANRGCLPPRHAFFRLGALGARQALFFYMAKVDDTALDARLTQLRQRDPTAFFEHLFRVFYVPLGGLAYRVVADKAAVEDILQDVFLRVWQGLATLPPLASHRAYLTRMVLNAALRYQQLGRRQVAWDAAFTAAPPAPVAATALADLHAADAAAAVGAALGQLPAQCRLVFELSRYEELSCQQIAEVLDIAPKTVENQLGKALRLLRRELAGVLKNLYGLLLALAAGQQVEVSSDRHPTLTLAVPAPPACLGMARRVNFAAEYLVADAGPMFARYPR